MGIVRPRACRGREIFVSFLGRRPVGRYSRRPKKKKNRNRQSVKADPGIFASGNENSTRELPNIYASRDREIRIDPTPAPRSLRGQHSGPSNKHQIFELEDYFVVRIYSCCPLQRIATGEQENIQVYPPEAISAKSAYLTRLGLPREGRAAASSMPQSWGRCARTIQCQR